MVELKHHDFVLATMHACLVTAMGVQELRIDPALLGHAHACRPERRQTSSIGVMDVITQ